MVTLKTSDKIIIIAAVAVIIIAAILIVVYYEPEEEVPTKPPGTEYVFDVIADVGSGTATPDNTDFTVKAPLLGDGSYNGSVAIAKDNLKSVEFTISYTDDKTGLFGFGLLGKSLGLDTLTISITDPDGGVTEEAISGSGNVTIFYSVNPKISLTEIEAETEEEARSLLEEQYYTDWKDEEFEVTATLTIGERFPRVFARLRERLLGRDSFDLEINYEYYTYRVELTEEETKGTALVDQGNYKDDLGLWAMILPMGYGRAT